MIVYIIYVSLLIQGAYISYDNVRSTLEKGNLANKKGYEGVFAWELTGDTDDFELLRAMN